MDHVGGFNDPFLQSSKNGKDPTGSSGPQNRASLPKTPGRVVAPHRILPTEEEQNALEKDSQ